MKVRVTKIFGGAIAAMKGRDFVFSSMVIIAKTKKEARAIAQKTCLERYSKHDGYILHEVSVTNAIMEVKA